MICYTGKYRVSFYRGGIEDRISQATLQHQDGIVHLVFLDKDTWELIVGQRFTRIERQRDTGVGFRFVEMV